MLLLEVLLFEVLLLVDVLLEADVSLLLEVAPLEEYEAASDDKETCNLLVRSSNATKSLIMLVYIEEVPVKEDKKPGPLKLLSVVR